MSLGLIMVDQNQTMAEAVNVLHSKMEMLPSECISFIIYTEHKKTDFEKHLHGVKVLSEKVYDITNEESFLSNCSSHFSHLVTVENSNICVRAL